MPLLSKKEVASILGIPTNHLSVLIQRSVKKNTLLLTGDHIDDSNPTNIQWLQSQKAKRDLKSETVQAETKPPEYRATPQKASTTKALKTETASLEAQKMEMQILKMQVEVEKLRLQNSKAKGNVIPVALIQPLFLQHNQSIITEGRNTGRDIIRIFAKKRELTPEEEAAISKEWDERLNEMMRRAAQGTTKTIDVIVNEYAIKRGAGQRD